MSYVETTSSPSEGEVIQTGEYNLRQYYDSIYMGAPYFSSRFYLDGAFVNFAGHNYTLNYAQGTYTFTVEKAYTWRIDIFNNDTQQWQTGTTHNFTVSDDVPSKPTTPSPANNATGVDFSDFTLGWVDGGNTNTYNVYIGETGALTLVSSAQTEVSYITTLSELETIFSASPINQKIYWRVDAVNETGTTTGDEWNFDPRPAKATTPSPAHEETDVGFTTTPLSYSTGDLVDIYFGIQGDELTKLAEVQDVTSWRMPYNILNIKDYNPATGSGYRSPQADDILTHGDDSYTVSHVVVGDLINVQYQAKIYAFRTAGPGGKNSGDVLTNGIAPDAENPQAVRVTLNDQWHFRGNVEEIYLPPSTTFEWRIDTSNDFGTTVAGDTWEFTTPAFKTPKTSYILISGGSGSGPYDYPPGVRGTDWDWTGENNMITIRRLVAAAWNAVWIEVI